MLHLIGHWLGLGNSAGPIYSFWSGAGSDLGEAAIIGGVASIVRRHNCHVHHCWRVGRHPVQGTVHVVCRRHHPDGHLTAAAARAAGGKDESEVA